MAEADPVEPIIEVLPVGPFQANAFILGCRETSKGVVIDPGDDGEMLLGRIRALGLSIEAILLTHGHLDHASAAPALREALGAPVFLHPDDAELYRMLPEQRRMFGLPEAEEPPPADRAIADDCTLRVGNLGIRFLHTPGHTLGSICIHVGSVLFTGDTLFRGSIGRTDIGGTSPEELIGSIRRRLYGLDDGTAVYPGHGERTTMGREKKANPFLVNS